MYIIFGEKERGHIFDSSFPHTSHICFGTKKKFVVYQILNIYESMCTYKYISSIYTLDQLAALRAASNLKPRSKKIHVKH